MLHCVFNCLENTAYFATFNCFSIMMKICSSNLIFVTTCVTKIYSSIFGKEQLIKKTSVGFILLTNYVEK